MPTASATSGVLIRPLNLSTVLQDSAKEAACVAGAGGKGIRPDLSVREGDGEQAMGEVAEGPGCSTGEGDLDREVEETWVLGGTAGSVASRKSSSSPLASSSSSREDGQMVFTEEASKWAPGASRRLPSRTSNSGSAMQKTDH